MRTEYPLVSVIVTTRNNRGTLEACLQSVVRQTHRPVELVVVYNGPVGGANDVARKYTNKVFSYGSKRPAQRNFGVEQAAGEYVLIIDSDTILSQDVVAACADVVWYEPRTRAVIIPERPFGMGFWAHCKQLEYSFYAGVDTVEVVRFFERQLYEWLGGYSEVMTGGEDWDLTCRVRAVPWASVGRIVPPMFCNQGHLRFLSEVRAMYYAQAAAASSVNGSSGPPFAVRPGLWRRYRLYLSQPRKLLKDPILGAGMLTLKTAECAAGMLGLIKSKVLKS